VALAVFLITYLFLAGVKVPFLKLDRPGAALVGAAAMVVLKVLTGEEAVKAVDTDTLLLLFGMMVITAYLTRAGFFRWAAWMVLHKATSPRMLLAGLVFITGALSAVLVNDTVCVMLTPLVLALVASVDLAPRPYLFALAMASNAGSVATFTGNPQNMLIGVASKLPYGQFVAFMLLPALVSLAVVFGFVVFAFRKELAPRQIEPSGPRPKIDKALFGVSVVVLVGVVIAFFAGLSMAWSAFVGAAVLALFARFEPREQLEKIDFVLLIFFACLFIIVAGVQHEGWATKMHDLFRPLMSGGTARETVGFSLLTLIASNIVSNVPFVMLARDWVPTMSNVALEWQVLALVSTLAGNLTILGSVANLIVFEGARDTAKVGFVEYLKLGVPVTLVSLALSLAVLALEHAIE
jgi:Na+/H+ antiporter NhaD/arsenite permease-like protein